MLFLRWIIFYTLVLLLFFQIGQVLSVGRKLASLNRVLNEFLKLKQFELSHNLPQKRNRITSVLESIIKEDEETAGKIAKKKYERVHNIKKAKIAPKTVKNPASKKAVPGTSAVESITFTAPQLQKVHKTEMDQLLQRMKINPLLNKEAPNIVGVNKKTPGILGVEQQKKGAINEIIPSSSVQSIIKIADKESDNPHPLTLNVNKFNTIFQQAHEGNNTGDEDLEDVAKTKSSTASKINQNPHPNPVRSQFDPLQIVSHRITNEDDIEKPDKPSGHENTADKRPDGVDYKVNKKPSRITKPPDNKSLAVHKEEKGSDPTRQKAHLKTRLFKNSKLPHVRKDVDADNWTDRKTHALAILAKIASDLDQQDVVENVLSALGISDIIKLDHPIVQHDEMDGSDDFRDKNWVDEELGGNSGSGDNIVSLNDLGKKQPIHEVQVIRESFVKGQPKDKISPRKKKIENSERNDLGNIVED